MEIKIPVSNKNSIPIKEFLKISKQVLKKYPKAKFVSHENGFLTFWTDIET
jgi:hypothetical protein